MKLIGENIHIISKATKEAVLNRNDLYLKQLIRKIYQSGVNYIDLNIGPARKGYEGTMAYLTDLCQNESPLPLCFDSTNSDEVKSGLISAKSPSDCIINSASADPERLEVMTSIAKEFDSHLICLALGEGGIAKTADERLILMDEIVNHASNKGISNKKLILDPLVLPISVEQPQVNVCFDTIRMFHETFGEDVSVVVGLSNISNGSPQKVRTWLNRTFAALAMGCGLNDAILDAADTELIRIMNMLKNNAPEKKSDQIYLKLYKMMQEFGSIDDIVYDDSDNEELSVIKSACVLLNKQVYSHSYLDVY